VQNNTDDPFEFVKVFAILYDDKQSVTGTGYTYTELDTIPAHGKSPFKFKTDKWAKTTDYRLQAEGEKGNQPRLDLVVTEHSSYAEGVWLHIQGQVKNTGQTQAESVKIAATIYDEHGHVIAVDSTYTESPTIPAGATSPFDLGTDHWRGAHRYEVQVQGQ
jgi:hypothetical protein